MLSYRHAYHVGNHADILKHINLVLILESMLKKDKPFTAIDCNAGAGIYHLDDERALQTGETQNGILKLRTLTEQIQKLPSSINSYLEIINKYIENNKYPGSPEIIHSFLRDMDKEILIELHNSEVEILRANILDRKVTILHENCFSALRGITPPLIKRGFLLMDPSYEDASDYENVANVICQTHKRWNVGILSIWYPLLAHRKIELEIMIDKICENAYLSGSEVCKSELIIDRTDKEMGLYGSGMLTVNPCWKLKEQMDEAVSFLQDKLTVSSY